MKKDEQANVLLSLKNLYRLFTVKDYPVYSTGILGEKSKKGLTLVRFWDEYLLYEWKGTRHGKEDEKISGHGHGIRSMAVQRVWREVDFLDQLHREKAEGFFQILWGCLVLYHALSACNGRSGNVRSENGTGKEPGGLKTEAYLELYLPEFRRDQAEFSYSTKL